MYDSANLLPESDAVSDPGIWTTSNDRQPLAMSEDNYTLGALRRNSTPGPSGAPPIHHTRVRRRDVQTLTIEKNARRKLADAFDVFRQSLPAELTETTNGRAELLMASAEWVT